MKWEKFDKMFPYGYAITDIGLLTKEQVLANNYDILELTIKVPCHDMLKRIDKIIWKENGDMDRVVLYHVYPQEIIDGKPFFNLYGQTILNNIKEEKMFK